MLQYKVIPRKNPLTKTDKFYPTLVSPMPVAIDRIAAEIEKISSLSRGDIKSVLDNLQHVVINHLQDGKSVRLGTLGTFRVSLRASGSDHKEEVSAANVKRIYPIFTPSTEMKDALKPEKVGLQKASPVGTAEP